MDEELQSNDKTKWQFRRSESCDDKRTQRLRAI